MVEIVIHWSIIIERARAVGRAKKSDDAGAITAAETRLEEVESIIRNCDNVTLKVPQHD